MKNFRLLLIAAVLVPVLMFTSCKDEDPLPTLNNATYQLLAIASDITDKEVRDVHVFNSAISKVNITDVTENAITVFVIKTGSIKGSLTTSVVRQHVIKGAYTKSMLTDGTKLQNIDGTEAKISKNENGQLLFNNDLVIASDGAQVDKSYYYLLSTPINEELIAIADGLDKVDNLSTFSKYFRDVNVSKVTESNLTVFVIKNRDAGDSLTTAIVQKNVIRGAYADDALTNGLELTTVDGDKAFIMVSNGKKYFNGKEITGSGVKISGSYYYTIATDVENDIIGKWSFIESEYQLTGVKVTGVSSSTIISIVKDAVIKAFPYYANGTFARFNADKTLNIMAKDVDAENGTYALTNDAEKDMSILTATLNDVLAKYTCVVANGVLTLNLDKSFLTDYLVDRMTDLPSNLSAQALKAALNESTVAFNYKIIFNNKKLE